MRSGALVGLTDEAGRESWGDIAPLPKWSKESLEESLSQLNVHKQSLLDHEWESDTYLKKLLTYSLYPSVFFGLESALLSLLTPLPEHKISVSALLMGTPDEIMEQAKQRKKEGFTSAKLKVSNLSFEEAARLIEELNDDFYLRIDVNRAWETADAMKFFSQFPKDTFDYVEEPFKDPIDLALFQHPLAIDESFPGLTLEQLETLPTLKALICKPTIQGGLYGCLPLRKWAMRCGISLVLSSSFESDVGLAHVASMAYRLSLPSPVGIGTYHHMSKYFCLDALKFSQGVLHVPLTLQIQRQAF